MKKLFFIAAVVMLCFFISCKDEGTSSTTSSSGTTSTADSNLEKNRRVIKAIETGDSVTIRSLIADDAIDHQGGPQGELKGVDNITHWLTDMHNHMKDFKMETIADAANGDYVFTFGTFKGTCTDGSMGMPAGTVMDEKVVDVVKVKDGKMVEHWGFLDAAAMMKNMPPMTGGHMDKMEGGKMEKMDSSKMKK
jgi:predicted ester cyclase